MFTKERGYEGYFIDYHGDDAGYRRFHQQYGTDAGRTDICRKFYIMALLSFCTFALLFKGKVNWKCNWLLRECGLEEEAERNRPLPPEETTEMLVFEEEEALPPTRNRGIVKRSSLVLLRM